MNVDKAKRVAIATGLVATGFALLVSFIFYIVSSTSASEKAEEAKYCAPDKMDHHFFTDSSQKTYGIVCKMSDGSYRVVVEK